MEENLINLIEKCKIKDKESVINMIEIFKPLIRKYEKLLAYEDATNDLHEKFIILLYKIPSYNHTYKILSYIDKSMYRAYIKLSQKKCRYINANILTDDFENYESYITQEDKRNLDLHKALKNLSDNQKNVIVYKFYKGYQTNEIARKMGVTRQTVYKTEKKALSNLKTMLT